MSEPFEVPLETPAMTAEWQRLQRFDNDYNDHSVKDVAKIDATEAAHRQFGQVRTDLDVMAEDLERLFTRMVKAKDVLLERGVRAEYVLSAPLEAALRAWELDKVDEAPLGPPLA